MLVVTNLVGGQVVHDLAAEQVHLGRPASTRRTAGRHDDDVLGRNQPRDQQRGEGEGDRGRIAARGRHPATGPDRLPCRRQLRHPVRPRARVLATVGPAPGVGVGEPVVGAQVDDADTVRQRRRDAGGRAVREREKDDVGVDAYKGRRVDEDPARKIGKVRVDLDNVPPGRRARRQRTDLDLRMPEQQTQQLPARVPTRPGHRRCHPHGVPMNENLYTQFHDHASSPMAPLTPLTM